MQVVNVQDFVLLRERSSLCMLPPPLNMLSIGSSVVDFVVLNSGVEDKHNLKPAARWDSRVADVVTR